MPAAMSGGSTSLGDDTSAQAPTLSDERFALLESELAKGPAAHGWEDQRWTLERVAALIPPVPGQLLGAGVWRLLHRHSWSWQSPARRALERDEYAVELWKKDVWPQVEALRGRSGAFIVFEDEAGFAMTPPRGRTGGQRGQAPVVRVRGRSRRRISVAALCCCRPGERSRLIYRPRYHLLLKGSRKSSSDRTTATSWSELTCSSTPQSLLPGTM
ncbi:winged helix-turn-helix domain-containing protein [Streptomyces sp. NPDC005345]|uniref:winged helix-turn-helix domain-containing protein n=1 Tax=Streptomyces sp. NPDC005345 TaxID=3156877 RepID=UPI0033A98479